MTGAIEEILVAAGMDDVTVSVDAAQLIKFVIPAGIMLRSQTMDEVRKTTAGLESMKEGEVPVVDDNKATSLAKEV